jgi:BlaI family penicillinase repressor
MNDLIPDSELEILKMLWEKAPQSLPEIMANLQQPCTWKATTIQTLLTRLIKRGAVQQEGRKRLYQYSPLISQDEYRLIACNHLLDKIFAGNTYDLIRFSIENKIISPSDFETFKQHLKPGEYRIS